MGEIRKKVSILRCKIKITKLKKAAADFYLKYVPFESLAAEILSSGKFPI